jgi:hypothetical protein
MQTAIPFHTADAVLAFSLYLAGIPFYDDTRPCINIYDENILKRLGFVGLELEEGVRRAVAKKKKGHLEYAFQRTPALSMLLKAYQEQSLALQNDEGTAVDVVHRLLKDLTTETEVSPFTIIRLACVILKMRIKFVNLWQQIVPLIRVFNEGDAVTIEDDMEGSGRVRRRFPGFKLVSLNASQATKDKMKL